MQKTAYELRIRDWSSDVCSSDLGGPARDLPERGCASPPEARHRFFCLQAIHSTVVPGLVPGTHWHWCKAMAYCIYILANRKHGTLYICITNDVARRIWEHRQGPGSRFVQRYGVTRLGYVELHDELAQAIQR